MGVIATLRQDTARLEEIGVSLEERLKALEVRVEALEKGKNKPRPPWWKRWLYAFMGLSTEALEQAAREGAEAAVKKRGSPLQGSTVIGG